MIRTEDHRLWAVGLCEEDRNFMCEPIPVTLDVPGKTENSVEVVPFFLSEQGIMRKGHLRVLVHSPGTAGFKEDRDLFEVVLHQEQAYCLPWRGLQQLPEEMQTGAIDVLDFSAGWKHDLLLVKKPPAPASAPVSSHEM